MHSSEELSSPATAVPGLRERKKAETRRALVAAATRLFLQDGVARTTVADITTTAGVSPRTFFLHFASKEDVLFHHVERHADAAVDAIADLASDATAWDGVQAAVRSLIDLFDAPGQGVDALAGLRAHAVRDDRGVPPSLAARLATLQTRVLDGLASRFPDAPPADVAAHVGAAVGAVTAAAVHAVTASTAPDPARTKAAMLGALERAGAGFAGRTSS